ncbi:ADP-ribosylation factor isoform X1 [Tanacetum coccineum]
MGLSFTKLFNPPKKEALIAMLGLDGAGKTTILYKLSEPGKVVLDYPTIGYNFESFEYKNLNFNVCELGGSTRLPVPWKHVAQRGIQGLIYVIDSWDRDPDRLLDAKNRLDDMLNEDVMRDGVLLVLANRHDLPDVMNVSEITDKLGLQFIQNRPWHILSTCATSGEGLYEGLDWLYSNIANKVTGSCGGSTL